MHINSSSLVFVKQIKLAHFYLLAIILGLLTSYFNIELLVGLAQTITDNFIKIFIVNSI